MQASLYEGARVWTFFVANPTNAVGGSFIHCLGDAADQLFPAIPPTQLVDRSYLAYIARVLFDLRNKHL